MVNVLIVQPNGSQHVISAKANETLLRSVLENQVDGLIGECGGNLSCATCHVFIDEEWARLIPPKTPDEEVMLQGASEEPTERSRLACQIHLTPALDGMIVRVPKSQR